VKSKVRTGVLVSGGGTNLQALIDAASDPGFPAEIVLVISNRPDAGALDRADKAGIAARVIRHGDYDGRAPFDAALDEALRAANCDIVCTAGFMRILTAGFVEGWRGRMINIHPSLLPAFPGLNTHQRALDASARIAGCTAHLVIPDLDAGPILAQAAVPILAGDTADSLAARVLTQEHLIYPLALKMVAEGRVRVEEGRAIISEQPAPGGDVLINPNPK
jgi:phosphoribosylglycinamide formyltransferase-1